MEGHAMTDDEQLDVLQIELDALERQRKAMCEQLDALCEQRNAEQNAIKVRCERMIEATTDLIAEVKQAARYHPDPDWADRNVAALQQGMRFFVDELRRAKLN
jgi:predicted  nucleic acid-binding Zn-ribbon protein